MPRSTETQALVDALVGSWRGTGTGGYPTIDPFEYTEEVTFNGRDDHPALLYEQRTWKRSEFGNVASHWETGLLRLSSDGTATVHNAQGGRAESLSGTWTQTDSGWKIELTSVGFSGDDRVTASTRVFRINGDTLSYVHEMKTTATDEMSIHLEAQLTRSSA